MTAEREFWTEAWGEFGPRITGLQAWPSLDEHWKRIPVAPLGYTPSPKGLVALNLAIFTLNGCLMPLQQSPTALSNLWQAGYMSLITLSVRFALEVAGGVAYARWVWRQLELTGDVAKAMERAGRLLWGARSSVELPWGGSATMTSINVMNFIDKMAASGYKEARLDYEFLCESCHPSFLQHVFWNMVSVPSSDFKNPLFEARMRAQLEQTVSSLEKACTFASTQAEDLLVEVLPSVDADRSRL